MRRAAGAALVAVAALAAPAAADAASTARAVRAAVAPLGRSASVVVADARSGKRIVGLRATRRQSLGSTTKLLTAAALLEVLDPGFALHTDVRATAPTDAAGVLHGDLELVGGGDPLLDDPQLEALADQLGNVREVTGAVVADEFVFDLLRTGPSGDGVFDAELGGPLSALAYRKGRATPDGPVQADPARAAAARFDDVLEARGVVIRGVPRAGDAPAVGGQIAMARSAPIRTLIAAMLPPSDDWIAEMLTKFLGHGTTADGAAAVEAAAHALGAQVTLVDGSGLDPRDRGSAADLVAVLRRLRGRPAFRAALARPGRPGTLKDRLTRGRARTACRGKTGTLPAGDVSALAGYCTTRAGRPLAFAVLARGVPVPAARRAQDRVAQALAGAR